MLGILRIETLMIFNSVEKPRLVTVHIWQPNQGCHASGRPRPRPPRPSDGGADRPPTAGRGGRPPATGAVLQGRPAEVDDCPARRRPSAIAVRLRRPSGPVRLCRPLSMNPISPFYTMCLLP
jgi:hypothetical protein